MIETKSMIESISFFHVFMFRIFSLITIQITSFKCTEHIYIYGYFRVNNLDARMKKMLFSTQITLTWNFRLFFFTVAPLSPLKMADYRLASLEGLNHVCSKKIDWPTATIHITENPISEAVVC